MHHNYPTSSLQHLVYCQTYCYTKGGNSLQNSSHKYNSYPIHLDKLVHQGYQYPVSYTHLDVYKRQAYMGLCYAHLGKYDEAVKALDSFDGDDQMVAPAMKGAMGLSLIHIYLNVNTSPNISIG